MASNGDAHHGGVGNGSGSGYTVIMSGPSSADILNAAADVIPMPTGAAPMPPSGGEQTLTPRNRVNKKMIQKSPTAPMPSSYVSPEAYANGVGRRESLGGYSRGSGSSNRKQLPRVVDPMPNMAAPRPPPTPPPVHTNGHSFRGSLAQPQPRPPRNPPPRSSGPVSSMRSSPVSPPISPRRSKRQSGTFRVNGDADPIDRPTSCPPTSHRMPHAHHRAQSMATGFNVAALNYSSPTASARERERGSESRFNFSQTPPHARRPPASSASAHVTPTHHHATTASGLPSPALITSLPRHGTASMPASMRRGETLSVIYRDGWSPNGKPRHSSPNIKSKISSIREESARSHSRSPSHGARAYNGDLGDVDDIHYSPPFPSVDHDRLPPSPSPFGPSNPYAKGVVSRSRGPSRGPLPHSSPEQETIPDNALASIGERVYEAPPSTNSTLNSIPSLLAGSQTSGPTSLGFEGDSPESSPDLVPLARQHPAPRLSLKKATASAGRMPRPAIPPPLLLGSDRKYSVPMPLQPKKAISRTTQSARSSPRGSLKAAPTGKPVAAPTGKPVAAPTGKPVAPTGKAAAPTRPPSHARSMSCAAPSVQPPPSHPKRSPFSQTRAPRAAGAMAEGGQRRRSSTHAQGAPPATFSTGGMPQGRRASSVLRNLAGGHQKRSSSSNPRGRTRPPPPQNTPPSSRASSKSGRRTRSVSSAGNEGGALPPAASNGDADASSSRGRTDLRTPAASSRRQSEYRAPRNSGAINLKDMLGGSEHPPPSTIVVSPPTASAAAPAIDEEVDISEAPPDFSAPIPEPIQAARSDGRPPQSHQRLSQAQPSTPLHATPERGGPDPMRMSPVQTFGVVQQQYHNDQHRGSLPRSMSSAGGYPVSPPVNANGDRSSPQLFHAKSMPPTATHISNPISLDRRPTHLGAMTPVGKARNSYSQSHSHPHPQRQEASRSESKENHASRGYGRPSLFGPRLLYSRPTDVPSRARPVPAFDEHKSPTPTRGSAYSGSSYSGSGSGGKAVTPLDASVLNSDSGTSRSDSSQSHSHSTTVESMTPAEVAELIMSVERRNSRLPSFDEDLFVSPKLATKVLDLDNHEWNFNSEECQTFRAQAARVDYRRLHPTPRLAAYPACYSISHIPAELRGLFTIRVKLPQSTQQSTHKHAFTSVACTLDVTTADDLIRKAAKKVRTNPVITKPTKHYILKGQGEEEYLFGDDIVTSYEYVRNNLRDGKEVWLSLVVDPQHELAIEKMKISLKRLRARSMYSRIEHVRTDFSGKTLDVTSEEELVKYDGLKYESFVTEERENWPYIPMLDLNYPYRLKIESILGFDNCPRITSFGETEFSLFVRHSLYVGTREIPNSSFDTPCAKASIGEPLEIPFDFWYTSPNIVFSQLPRETRVSFMLYARGDNRDVLLGWVNQNLVDHRHRLRSKQYALSMWMLPKVEKEKERSLEKSEEGVVKDVLIARGTASPNVKYEHPSRHRSCIIYLKYETFQQDVVYPPDAFPKIDFHVKPSIPLRDFSDRDRHTMDISLANIDPLTVMTPGQKHLLWSAREHLTRNDLLLPIFLRIVDWTKIDEAAEARRLLKIWKPPTPHNSLELLGCHFPDKAVREYAVAILRNMHVCHLHEFLIQLVQCLKFEHNHFSALSQFLIDRALVYPVQIAHPLFWHLKSELHDTQYSERYGLILEQLLLHCGPLSLHFLQEQDTINKLLEVAVNIAALKMKKIHTKPELKAILRERLEVINKQLPERFTVPLNPKWRVGKLIIEKCTYMSSKKVPLWLCFQNADPDAENVLLILKSGDDLRQDFLTLQLLRVMDQLWMNSNLDLRLCPYMCVSTGVNEENEGVGMIEIVKNSMTINDIQKEFGGAKVGALYTKTLRSYLQLHNKGGVLDAAVENFARSMAGYIVATYVMGIGDRHSDNIMLQQGGRLFHIDFGHFLGNFKSKLNIKRERSPFVYTPEMQKVMEKMENYDQFKKNCSQAYNVLRKFHRILIVLFLLMVPARMPELLVDNDIGYLRETLFLELNDIEASENLHKQMKKSLKDKTRILDNVIHALVHN